MSIGNLDLTGKNYADMPTGFRDAYSKEEFKTERRAQNNRMAGDAVVEEAKSPKSGMTAGKVDNIDNFDRSAGGAGAQRGEDRLSAADLKNLQSQGFSNQEIIDYSERSSRIVNS